MLDCRYRDGPPPSQRREILQTTFCGGSGGNGRVVLHCISAASRSARPLPARLNRPCRSPQSLRSDFFEARLRCSLFVIGLLKGKIPRYVLTQSSLEQRPGGNSSPVFHPNFFDARLRCSLL